MITQRPLLLDLNENFLRLTIGYLVKDSHFNY